MLAAPDASGEEAALERMGYLLRGSPVRIVAPDEFLDPVTDCLILEPVTLLNTDTTLDRLTLQEWLRAGALPSFYLSTNCTAGAACHAPRCCRLHKKCTLPAGPCCLSIRFVSVPSGLLICKNFWEPHLLTAACSLLQATRSARARTRRSTTGSACAPTTTCARASLPGPSSAALTWTRSSLRTTPRPAPHERGHMILQHCNEAGANRITRIFFWNGFANSRFRYIQGTGTGHCYQNCGWAVGVISKTSTLDYQHSGRS